MPKQVKNGFLERRVVLHSFPSGTTLIHKIRTNQLEL